MATTSGKGGYDCSFVDTPPKHLECPICLLTVREPHLTSCCGNQYYCRTCIERVQKEGRPCPLCNQAGFTVFLHKGVEREVKTLKVYCPQKALGCEWKGELSQVDDHVSQEGGSECGYAEIACANGCGQCFQRRLLAAHQTDECPNRPVETQIASMMKMLQLQSTEIAQLKDMQEQSSSRFLKDNAALQAENRLLKEELQALKLRFTPLPPFLFTIDNYQHYKKNELECHSPPFYSHAEGYKLHFEVYPNGFGDGRGSHVSVFVSIMKGEYDDSLKWPFQGNVMFGLRKPGTSDVFHCSVVTFDDNSPRECCHKPQHCVSLKGIGSSQYLSRKEVSTFARDNRLRFVVSKVEVFSL